MELVLTAEHSHSSHIGPATEARSALSDAQEREERFLALLLPAKHSLSRFIAALERNDDDARDCMSETIAVAWREFDALTSNEAFLSWIMTIARRLVYRKERREKFRGWLRQPRRFFAQYDDDDYAEDDFSLLSDDENSAYSPDTATDIQILYAMLTRLPFKQREAVILSEIVGYSLQEIAEMQGDGLSAVKQRVVRGREKLRAMLRDN
ncbi:MAG: RNA polymerase sigma factor [Candidatus Kapabacteria bacterium]|jgi:RNA polymerase sigma-70 factor (ECF subfamily)|nr:RNA polymerase sigma factor [Candidatus Kapabacteria bacterium]